MIGRSTRQRGGALISVIFLIVVVAGLGAFAIRTSGDYQQQAILTLQEVRADAAAYSGLEYATHRLNAGTACWPVPMVVPLPANNPGMTGVTVRVECATVASVPTVGNVFDLRATAAFSTFGNADYVQRVRTRRVSNIGAGSW